MSLNPGINEVVDKNGTVADIEAKRFDSSRTVKLDGDVTGTTTWQGTPDADSSTPSLNIATTIPDGTVTKAKMDESAYDETAGSIADGTNSNLATKTQVKTYVDEQTLRMRYAATNTLRFYRGLLTT